MKKAVSTSCTKKMEHCNMCSIDLAMDNQCCHSESKLVKLTQDENTTSFILFSLINPTAIALTGFQNFIVPTPAIVSSQFEFRSPPLLLAKDIYKTINVFRV